MCLRIPHVYNLLYLLVEQSTQFSYAVIDALSTAATRTYEVCLAVLQRESEQTLTSSFTILVSQTKQCDREE
jgi:hypothetical protein